MQNKENQIMIHYVIELDNMYGVDIHTHGLNKFKHPELQLVLPFEQNEIANFVNWLANKVITGQDIYKEGERLGLLTDNYRLWFIEVNDPFEEGMKELRIIYPDENNHMPWEKDCDEYYQGQIADISPEKIREVLSKCN
jgi:hypothetical protein